VKRAWQIAAAAFAVLFLIWAQQSWSLSLTDALGPGPGFFPFWLSLLGAGLSIALIVQMQRAPPPDAPAEMQVLPPASVARPVYALLAALTGVAVLLEPLGFRLCVAVFCLTVLPAMGARNWLVIIAFALVSSFGVHALFSDLLKVPLPIGLLGI